MNFFRQIALIGAIVLTCSCDGPIKVEIADNSKTTELTSSKDDGWISLGKIKVDEWSSYSIYECDDLDLYALIVDGHCFYKIKDKSNSYYAVIGGSFKKRYAGEDYYYNSKAGKYYFNMNK